MGAYEQSSTHNHVRRLDTDSVGIHKRRSFRPSVSWRILSCWNYFNRYRNYTMERTEMRAIMLDWAKSSPYTIIAAVIGIAITSAWIAYVEVIL